MAKPAGLSQYQFWFVVGSQHLYGEETLKQVREHARTIADSLNQAAEIPAQVVYKPIVTTPDDILQTMMAANADASCAGVITWMHTFSPSKMWIGGLNALQDAFWHEHGIGGRFTQKRPPFLCESHKIQCN